MKYSILFTAFLFFQITSKAQSDTTSFNSFTVLIEQNLMKVENEKGKCDYFKNNSTDLTNILRILMRINLMS